MKYKAILFGHVKQFENPHVIRKGELVRSPLGWSEVLEIGHFTDEDFAVLVLSRKNMKYDDNKLTDNGWKKL